MRTLVLGRNYMPISCFPNLHTIDAQDAIKSYLEDKVEVLSFYDRPILSKGLPINHPIKGILFWPSVVVDHKKKAREAIRLTRSVLYYRERCKCFWCKQPLASVNEVTKDHVLPISKGGENKFENVVASCKKCNAEKGNHLPTGKWSVGTRVIRTPTFFEILEERKKHPLVIYDDQWANFLPSWVGDIEVRSPWPRKAYEIVEDMEKQDELLHS